MQFLRTLSYWFLGFCVLFIPFPFYIFSLQKEISNYLFVRLSSWIVENIFGWNIINSEITSDSATMYGLVLSLFIGTIIFSTSSYFFPLIKKYQHRIFQILRVIFYYYLAMQLLKYGFDKIFKSQFYLPEPNILFTPLGKIDKDLLFWSTMGTSRSYNIFMGMLEVLPAIFLLFKKTRPLGLLITIPVLINVVAINFSFDISVKIYSVFLLLLSCFLFAPYLKNFYHFFILKKEVVLNTPPSFVIKNSFLQILLKIFVIGIIFLEIISPYIFTKNFNDDKASRPYLHGAYEVVEILPKDSLVSETPNLKRIFIHRNGYLIFQSEKDDMVDFKLNINRDSGKFELTNYQEQQIKLNYQYFPSSKILEIHFFQNQNEFLLKTKSIDLKNLPALQNNFHWHIDDF